MSQEKRYCPSCVELLKTQRKRNFGHVLLWLVCPKCGYRTTEGSEMFNDEKNHDSFKKTREELDNIQNQHFK